MGPFICGFLKINTADLCNLWLNLQMHNLEYQRPIVGLEHPWILIFMAGPGTNFLWILRDNCSIIIVLSLIITVNLYIYIQASIGVLEHSPGIRRDYRTLAKFAFNGVTCLLLHLSCVLVRSLNARAMLFIAAVLELNIEPGRVFSQSFMDA